MDIELKIIATIYSWYLKIIATWTQLPKKRRDPRPTTALVEVSYSAKCQIRIDRLCCLGLSPNMTSIQRPVPAFIYIRRRTCFAAYSGSYSLSSYSYYKGTRLDQLERVLVSGKKDAINLFQVDPEVPSLPEITTNKREREVRLSNS